MSGGIRTVNADITTRAASPGDAGFLRELWKSAFGDSDGDVSAFLECFGGSAVPVIAELSGREGAAGYVIPAGELVYTDATRAPCAMLYAIASRQELRGRGLGAAVTRALTRRARELGYPAVVLHPADDGLFDFYSANAGFREWFSARELVFRADGQPRRPCADVRAVTSAEYREIRARILRGRAHIHIGERAAEYQRLLCEQSGGGLFAIRSGGAESCAAAEGAPGGAAVKELLTSAGGAEPCAAALASAMSVGELTARVPAWTGDGARRFGMMYADGAPPGGRWTSGGWFGPAFD
ncbi:MAG: GNAT family N-acetyltransferase [Oscillospiraceae bacterium]|nr:GNAT family N-acetyltransferase [Oscillospiraceae bacterium]